MTTHVVNAHQAKTGLSELIRYAESGDTVILARAGKPVARIVALPGAQPTRIPGGWKGRASYGADLVGSDDEVVAAFDESTQR